MKRAFKLNYRDHKERIKKAIKIRRRAKHALAKKLKSKALAKMIYAGIGFFKPAAYKKTNSFDCGNTKKDTI